MSIDPPLQPCSPETPYGSRRAFLAKAGCGLGAVALSSLWADAGRAVAPLGKFGPPRIDTVNPLQARAPHFAARAKRVIFLFMSGAPSHVDLYDYKPQLVKLTGQKLPESFKRDDKVKGVIKHCKDELFASKRTWKQHGQCGRWMSDLLPHVSQRVDDLCFVHSMYSESSNHAPATFQMNTGVVLGGKPSLGSWLTYGLGTENNNLPGFVLLFHVGGFGGSANYSSAFLPAAFQGTRFRNTGDPVLYLRPPEGIDGNQRTALDLAQAFNREHLLARAGSLELEGRIASYELAYRMQSEALAVGDLTGETAATHKLYGLDQPETEKFGRMCLAARRLSERGVRFVQVYSAFDGNGWDAHGDLDKNHAACAKNVDQPIAALLADLKQRGLLNETLVVCTGEFGRTPLMQGNNGRNHSPWGFTTWLAGGGVTPGTAIGATDELGLRSLELPQSVGNLHHTLLTAMGLDPESLSFEHLGRPERLTGVAGSTGLIPGVLRED